MHNGSLNGAYKAGPGYQAAELWFGNSGLVMYAVLPAVGTTPEQALSKISVEGIMKASSPDPLDLKLPRFAIDFSGGLKDSLTSMGMGIAFQGGADFSPMGPRQLVIGQVLHKTRLEINEEGALATAATAISMRDGAIRSRRQLKVLTFDRPFGLLICDSTSYSVLFAGVVYEP